MGSGASAPDPCLAGFFALRCFSLITIWVTPESWAVKPITSLPHWFYTRILRVPKCFSPQAFSLTPKSAHNLGDASIPQIAKAPEHHNDFGGVLGGPIQKDKTFFFASYEGARLNLPSTLEIQVPYFGSAVPSCSPA